MQRTRTHKWRKVIAAASGVLLLLLGSNVSWVIAESPSAKSGNVKRVLAPFSIFSKHFDARGGVFDLQEIDETESMHKEPIDSFARTEGQNEGPEAAKPKSLSTPQPALRYYSDDPTQDPILPPDQDASIRVMPDAPAPARAMIGAYRVGDHELADSYASQLVRMQKNYFFEVREITDLIGKALLREQVIEEDDWLGAGQLMEIELAKTRSEMNALLKPDHDTAMKRIKPDNGGKAKVYYFFSLQCSWCRVMAPDVERLWRITQSDPNVDLVGLTIGEATDEWFREYREYTGLSIPMYRGEELAQKWNIRFLPAVVIVAPSNEQAYLKTGQQSFARLYQFLRRVQGLPATITSEVQTIVETPIGVVEQRIRKERPQGRMAQARRKPLPVVQRSGPKKVKIDRF